MTETDPTARFQQEVQAQVAAIGRDQGLFDLGFQFLLRALSLRYVYNFSWLGRPIIQIPQDIYAVQELMWATRPDLVLETGVAHGGSLILSASMLAMLDYVEASEAATTLDPRASRRRVWGVDIEIRPHNRAAIEAHPLAHLIELFEGSSIAEASVAAARTRAAAAERVMVCLDSNHSHEHVLAELRAYAPLVSPGQWLVVWDTGVEYLPPGMVTDRPWGPGDNPMTAMDAYLDEVRERPVQDALGRPVRFEIVESVHHKLVVTAAPRGFLRRLPVDG